MVLKPPVPGPVLPDLNRLMRPGVLNLQALPPLSLYIHLPWCLKKCPYCDFNSHEARGPAAFKTDDELHRQYVQALIQDLQASLPLFWGRPIYSVFIGGGTPSLFSPDCIADLLSHVRALVRLDPDAEITLEANPGTFERERFRAYRQAGVTRLSVGVQSFSDMHLSRLGRVHDGAQARLAMEEVASTFDTFNLDLMYALPGQSLREFEADLTTALSFAPPHLSIYHLTIEPNTFFAKHTPTDLPDEDTAWDMLDAVTALSEQHGLARYEVSAYAKPGHHCRHNLNYWEFGDYLGIGAGAHGKLSFPHRVTRQVRLRDPMRYMDAALQGNAVAQFDEVPRKDLPFEFMLNALRLKQGVPEAYLTERTGLPSSSWQRGVEQGIEKGWLIRTTDRIQPTAAGFDFLSDLQALFLAE